MSLSVRTKHVNAIIGLKGFEGKDIKPLLLKLDKVLSEISELYAYIVHDRDSTPDGTYKFLHIHVVIQLKKATRLSTCLNMLSGSLELSPLAIQIEKYTSWEGSVQYLIHKNNADKYQYEISEIRKNFSDDDLENYMDSPSSGIDFDLWCSICKRADTLCDVIRGIGITYYNMYRMTIKDIFEEMQREKRLIG